jgi:glutamate racemase
MAQSQNIDAIVLGCTHYPLLINKIRAYLPETIQVLSQGEIVAESLADYLRRHPEMETRCSKNSRVQYYTTESAADFEAKAAIFMGKPVEALHLPL